MVFTRLAVCLVLSAVLATAAAKEWHKGVVFYNTAKAATAFTNTKTKVSGGYQSPELRQVCLRAAKTNNCQNYGCLDALACSGFCAGCRTDRTYQTELTCCKDKEHEADGAAGDMSTYAPDLKVGTCDWTFNVYQCQQDIYGLDCTQGTLGSHGFTLENNVEKIGTAWGTCYFNSESESCGHPFCGKMVMSFQGGWYYMPAYTVGDPYAQAPELDESCGGGKRNQAVKRAAQHSKVAQKLLEQAPTALDRLPSRRTSRRSEGATEYYLGEARVFSGPVTVTSLSHNMEYNRGMLEFVEFFAPDTGVPVSTPPPGVMPVLPFTMTITLASTRGSYDSYQPRVDESSEGKHGYHN